MSICVNLIELNKPISSGCKIKFQNLEDTKLTQSASLIFLLLMEYLMKLAPAAILEKGFQDRVTEFSVLVSIVGVSSWAGIVVTGVTAHSLPIDVGILKPFLLSEIFKRFDDVACTWNK